MYQLPTGTYDTRAAMAVKGGSFRDVRHLAATAVLVRHPKGDLLIDAGFGAQVADHVAALSRIARAPYQVYRTVARQFAAVGYDQRNLMGVVLTHSHWDHVSGLDSLQAPVWMNEPELEYAAADPDGKVYRMVITGHEVHEYRLDGPPYLGFRSSLDVHGDGSIVIALAGGHTTGSVVIFVTPPNSTRYAFIGDLTWQSDGIRKRVERPWLLRTLADSDAAQVRRGLRHAIALDGRMQIVPAHDVSSYDGIPLLAPRSSTSGAA